MLFNHESELRPEAFMSKKIVSAISRQANGSSETLSLGLWSHRRDWVAGDFVGDDSAFGKWRAWKLCFSSDSLHSIKDWLVIGYEFAGIPAIFEGEGIHEQCIHAESGRLLANIDRRFIRPTEPKSLRGDSSKIRSSIDWAPELSFTELVHRMLASELNQKSWI